MSNFQPLLALAGFFVGSAAWSVTVRFAGALLGGKTLTAPLPAKIVVSKVGRVIIWLAVAWVCVVGIALAVSTSIGASNAWRWLFGGILLVPFVWVSVFFAGFRKGRTP